MNTNYLISISAFGILGLAWLVFGASLIFNSSLLDAVWQAFRGMPLILQIVVGFLLLPVVAGLWIWESDLPFLARLILVVVLGAATLYTFFPVNPSIRKTI